MKVGMICPYDWSYPGGVRSHIAGLSASLTGLGIEVEVLAPSSSDEPGIYSVGKTLAIPFNGSVARLCFSPRSNARVKQRLATGDLDLLHIHEPASPSASLLALKHAGIPVVATFHASAERSRAYAAARPLLSPLFKKISQRIAVSTASKRLVSAYFPGEYTLIPNGIEYDRFAGAEPAELKKGRPIVLFVGRPEPRKGLSILIEAMEQVRSRLEADLVAVGPTAGDVPGWVRALGPVGQEALPGIYKAADVFAAPSLGGESFGIVLAEAMAAGTPVVCSDIPGYVEAAAGAALHCPAGDASALAKAILEVLGDSGQTSDPAAGLVARGKARASQLDWKVLVEQVSNCYTAALS
jgi:phosphatidyl-myo-inositol alpha-mannosyltransferase